MKIIRVDNGKEFCWNDLYDKNGIIHQSSCNETPQQNSIVVTSVVLLSSTNLNPRLYMGSFKTPCLYFGGLVNLYYPLLWVLE